MQEPDVLEPGRVRVAVGASYDFDKNGQTNVNPEAAARVGIARRTELRLKGNPSGLELGADIELHESERVRMLIMPQYRAYFGVTEDSDSGFDENYESDAADIQAAAVPLVVAAKTPSHIEPFFGTGPHAGTSDGKPFAAMAFHLGVSIPFGDHFSVIPECSTLLSVAGPARLVKNDDGDHVKPMLHAGDGMVQCGASISFGSRYAK